MMDPYGQFEALEHGWRMFMHGKRRSGRSSALIAAMDDGDMVLITDHAYGRRLAADAKRAGKEIETYVYPTKPGRFWDGLPHIMQAMRGKQRRLWFDHMWVECFIADRIAEIGTEFTHFREQIEEVNRHVETIAPHGMQLEVRRDHLDEFPLDKG